MRYLLITSLLFLNITLFNAQSGLEPSGNVKDVFASYKSNIIHKKKAVWGISLGATIDFGRKRNASFRLFVSGAIAKNLYHKNKFNTLATMQSEVEFFRGGIGSSVLNDDRYKFHIEMRTYPQLVFGLDYGMEMDGRPMNISIGQSMSTLYDPFDGSVSIGTIFINGINHNRNQQLGFFSLGVRQFQGYYANDGPPFGSFGFGDSFDRLWTGAGQLGVYFLNDFGFITDFAIRYDKFTGYQPDLYELSYTLQVDNLPYKDTEKQYYNQSRYQIRLGLRNTTHLTGSIFNPKRGDVQDYIHYGFSYPYHVNPMETFFTLGVDYQYKYLNIIK